MEILCRKQCEHIVWILLFLLFAAVKADYVEIKSTGSSVIGGTVNFSAVLYDDGQIASKGNYMFTWEDNTKAANKKPINTKYPYSNWSVTYPMNTTQPGDYRVTLKVEKNYLFWINIATNHIDFKLDENLGGEMLLLQNDTKSKKDAVSTGKPVNHTIQLRPNDAELLAEKAYEVQTYWFRNCTYIGVVNGLSYVAQYTEPEQSYKIEALVVATFEKPPEPTTTTTTTTTSTTTTTTTTTTTPKPTTTTPATTTTSTTSTTPKPNTNTTTTTVKTPLANATTILPVHRQRRAATESMPLAMLAANHPSPLIPSAPATAPNTSNQTHSTTNSSTNAASPNKKLALPILMSPLYMHEEPPYNCVTGQFIQRDPKKLYGLFKHYAVAKAPVSDFKANGQNWLQRGDMMRLQVNCKGSPSLEMCIQVFNAPYNATGNETCRYYFPLDMCEYNYTRFFFESKTILFFIRNDVSEKLNQVTINIYEAKVQSQLSVVVVPVSFTLIAVILIVFGVSYHIQSRNRFTVEVADFNFGETQSLDMEYKTFQQRLVDSIREVWPWRPRYSEFGSDMEPELDHNGRINGTFDNNIERQLLDNSELEIENNTTTRTTDASNGNTAVDSNLRYNSMT